MKLRHHVLSAVVFGAIALAAIAPAASADHDDDDDRGDRGRWHESRGYNDRYDRNGRYDRGYGDGRRYRRSERRSYYYEDPYCGRRSQYISDFKNHYSHAGHAPLILKRDIRSGELLARYRYDYRAEEWRDWRTWDREYRRGGYGGRWRG
jgi:hypothetical protein